MTIYRMECVGIEDITPEELAEEFWRMGADEQALFFDHLARKSSGYLAMQLQAVSDSPELTTEARVCMQSVGEYGEVC